MLEQLCIVITLQVTDKRTGAKYLDNSNCPTTPGDILNFFKYAQSLTSAVVDADKAGTLPRISLDPNQIDSASLSSA